jgi:hypothetical protein
MRRKGRSVTPDIGARKARPGADTFPICKLERVESLSVLKK